MLLPVLTVAALLRLPGITSGPPGFRHDEAAVALAAQRIERGSFPIYFRSGDEAFHPAFLYIVNLTGQLAGWGVSGPRLAAALCGITAAVACSLWYRQMLGSVWGLAGGLLMATSFWQIVISRQAVPAITMAAVGGFGLWALWRAAENSRLGGRRIPSGWFGVAGFAFGIGIYTDVTMRASVPITILIGLFLFYKKGYPGAHTDRRGLLLGLIVMLLVSAPLASYFWAHPDTFRLGMIGPDGLPAGERITSTLSALVWSGAEDWGQNIAGRPLFDPILTVWMLIGLACMLRHPLRSHHAVPLIWFLGFLTMVIVTAPGDHGQLLALTPVLFLFPLLAMREAVRVAGKRSRRWGGVAIALVALSISGSSAWSIYDYFREWAPHPETYRAFQGDVRDAVEEIAALPSDNIVVYFSTGEQGRVVRYLAPDRPRRDFDDPAAVPIPVDGPAYLIAPASADIDAPISRYFSDDSLVATGTRPDGERAYRMWFVDSRTRESLPYAVPAIFFEGGYELLGFEISPRETGEDRPWIDVVLVLRAPVGSDPFWVLARLVPPGADSPADEGRVVQPGPDYVVDGSEIILTQIVMPFPETAQMVADLQAALQTLEREYLTPFGPGVTVINGTHAILNAIGYIGR